MRRDSFEDENGCADLDNDNDGITDANDKCPIEPETKNGFADSDGCADIADRDGDGVRDDADKCPDAAEDVDQFTDEDGCPDPDNDNDTVLDAQDRCPVQAGPPDNTGCPDQDRDGDTVVDRLDNCPDEKGDPKNQGCAKPQLVVITGGELKVLDIVYFELDRAVLLNRSNRLLDNVASVLLQHTEITAVDVEGHTDNQGNDDYNKKLSQRRAEAVVAYLVKKGVKADRLRPIGYGEERPIETNDTRAGRAKNRRVDFKITGGTNVKIQRTGPGDDTIEKGGKP